MTSGKNSWRGQKEKNRVPDKIAIAIVMKVIVTLNIKTNIYMTNRAQGATVGMKLDAPARRN
jgi:hypothetical protein